MRRSSSGVLSNSKNPEVRMTKKCKHAEGLRLQCDDCGEVVYSATEGRTVVPGDVVQIHPEIESDFAGCLMVVTDVQPDTDTPEVKGYVSVPGDEIQADIYVAKPGDYMRIGRAPWLLSPEEVSAQGEGEEAAGDDDE